MCSVEGCSGPVVARGWCSKHYGRWYRLGDPLALKYAEYGSDAETRLRHHGWTVTDTGCWEWSGNRLQKGYGQLQFNGVMWQAHRLAYTAWLGPIPEGLFVLHACDNPPCINPDHLRTGTHDDNMRDRTERNRLPDFHGERHPQAKLNWEKVREIRASAESDQLLASKYGVDPKAIWSVRAGRTWKE